MTFLDDYLAGLRQRQQAYLNPHLGDIPVLGGLLGHVAPGAAATPLPGALAPLTGVSQAAAAGELSHQADTIGQLLVGAGVLGSAHIDRLTGRASPDADAALAAASGAADPLTAFMAVHGAEAQAHPRVIGALDMAYNPLNYVAGVEGLAGKLGLRGVATGARVLNEAINAPAAIAGGQVLRPLGREIAGKVSAQVPQLAARALSAAEPAAQTAARAGEEAIARGPGTPAVEEAARGLNPPLPIPPPTITAPPRAPFTADVARDMLLDQLGGAPMPAKARLLGALNEANFGGGAANAMRAVTGGADLGALGDLERPFTNYLLQRTIETPAALESLQTLHPGLHRAVDLLPDLPERTALDLQNEVRRAAGLPEKVVKPPRAPKAARVAALPDAEAAGVGEMGATSPMGKVEPIPPTPGGELTAAQAAYEAATTPEAKLAAERQFVDAYQGAGAAAPAEQVAREGAAAGNRGQGLFARMRQEAVPAIEGAATPAATRDLPAGTLPAPPATNYRAPLADYTDRLYHETDPEGASFLLEGQVSRPEMFYSNTPDLALGQGGKGVLVELTPDGIRGQINKKPAWEVAWQSGAAEFRDPLPSGPTIRDNIRSVTIRPDLRGRDPYLVRIRRQLAREGWRPATLDDGAVRYTRAPSAPQEAAQAATRALPEAAPTVAQAALPEAPPDLRPGAVPPDQLATINRLMEHHPASGINEDPALYNALRAEALRRGISEPAIARAEAAIPDTLRRQFAESPQLIRDRIAEIEASPEGQTFKYINPRGQFKLVDIRTGRPIALRGRGGALRASLEAPWNVPGTHYDEVAQEALSSRLGPDAVDTTNLDDFFTRARDMWQERRDLRAQLGEATRATGSYTETAGMGGQAPIQLATTLAGAAGGGLAGYQAAGDQASPTDRAAATLAGAAAGGTAGHLGPALLARPGESALRGIAAAGGGPVEAVARGVLGGDVAGKVLPFAREEALAQHVAGSQVQALLPRLRQMGGIWARNVTQTARNALQDETWLRFVLRGLQPGAASELGTVRRAMADRLNLATEWERYPTTTTGPLQAAGVTDATLNLGQTFHGTEGYLNEVLSNAQNAIGEAGLSFLNPVKAAMNLPSVAFAGAKGYARNYQAGLFKAVNQFQQLSARHAVFADEFTTRLAQAADRFLPDLERRGYDVTPLRQKLASEGAFSPDDVRRAMMGDNPAVQAWERTVGAVKDTAEGRARKLLGDYSKRGVIERKAGGVVPFVSWQLRAWPVMAEMIATHPGAALAVGNLLRLSGQQVTANKEPIGNVGTIPIQTPAGTVRLNPLSAVAPGSPEMLTLGSEDPNAPEDRTAFQTASDLLQKVGLGFGPGAQALAYATSQDYKGPGPLSRTAGIENAIGQVPFLQLPSLGAAGLDAARLLLRQPIEKVSAGPKLPLAGGAQPDYDPNLRRAQELSYDATGKAIGQPGTGPAAALTLNPSSPLMSRARGDVATSGALRNALSLVLPVGVRAQTPEAGAAQRARANAPISAAELARYKEESPTLYKLATQRNAQYQAANPVAAIYEANTPTERKLAILHDWDRQHSGLLVDRKVFLARRKQVLDALGLKDNATTRFDIAELAAPAR